MLPRYRCSGVVKLELQWYADYQSGGKSVLDEYRRLLHWRIEEHLCTDTQSDVCAGSRAIDGRGLEVQVGSTIAVLYMDGCSG